MAAAISVVSAAYKDISSNQGNINASGGGDGAVKKPTRWMREKRRTESLLEKAEEKEKEAEEKEKELVLHEFCLQEKAEELELLADHLEFERRDLIRMKEEMNTEMKEMEVKMELEVEQVKAKAAKDIADLKRRFEEELK